MAAYMAANNRRTIRIAVDSFVLKSSRLHPEGARHRCEYEWFAKP